MVINLNDELSIENISSDDSDILMESPIKPNLINIRKTQIFHSLKKINKNEKETKTQE